MAQFELGWVILNEILERFGKTIHQIEHSVEKVTSELGLQEGVEAMGLHGLRENGTETEKGGTRVTGDEQTGKMVTNCHGHHEL